jgi:HTH-type transcriptional regulator / antitoxin HigA
MKTASKLSFSRLPKTYDKLIKFHVPRPIHDEIGYKNTVEVVDALVGHQVNEDQDDYLLVLSGLVERYESDSLPERRSISGLSMLKYLLAENSLTGDDLAPILGVDRSVAYRILKGERGLTTAHVKALRDRFGVSADLFV